MHTFGNFAVNVEEKDCQRTLLYTKYCHHTSTDRNDLEPTIHEKKWGEYEVHIQIYHEGNSGKPLTEIRWALWEIFRKNFSSKRGAHKYISRPYPEEESQVQISEQRIPNSFVRKCRV